jgi:hypothetical protein
MRFDLALGAWAAISAIALSSCVAVLGEYQVEGDPDDAAGGAAGASNAVGQGGSGGTDDAECHGDRDCPLAEEGCDQGRCAKRCLDSRMCPLFTGCWTDHCSEPVGTPCDDDDDCGYTCLDVDANGQPNPGYCTGPSASHSNAASRQSRSSAWRLVLS